MAEAREAASPRAMTLADAWLWGESPDCPHPTLDDFDRGECGPCEQARMAKFLDDVSDFARRQGAEEMRERAAGVAETFDDMTVATKYVRDKIEALSTNPTRTTVDILWREGERAGLVEAIRALGDSA